MKNDVDAHTAAEAHVTPPRTHATFFAVGFHTSLDDEASGSTRTFGDDVALRLSQGLRDAQQAFAGGETSGPALEAAVRARLEAAAAELDYVELVDPGNLARLAVAVPGAVLAVAAKVGSTRLIDNHALGQPWR